MDPRTDRELVEAINAGFGTPAAAEAFETLYRRHRDWVVAVAHRVGGDRELALDVMQETFLYLLRKFPGLELTADLRGLLYPAIRHLAIAQRQKARRMRSDDQAAAQAPAAEAPLPGDDPRAALAAALASLNEGQREVLILRFVDGLSLQDVAAALGLPLGTVKSRLHHALAALRADPGTKDFF